MASRRCCAATAPPLALTPQPSTLDPATVGPNCPGIASNNPGLAKYITGAIGFPFALLQASGAVGWHGWHGCLRWPAVAPLCSCHVLPAPSPLRYLSAFAPFGLQILVCGFELFTTVL